MVRRSKPKRTLNFSRSLNWLPVTVAVVLTIVLVAKWSMAGLLEPHVKSTKARHFQSVQPELLLSDAVSQIVPKVQAGVWSMEGSIWNFENETVSTLQLALTLQQTGETAELGSDSAEHLSLIDLIPSQRANVEHVGATTTRRIDFGSIQANVRYREADGRRFFISAKVANRMDADHWQLITLSPKAIASSDTGHLLPLEGTGSSVCQRFGKAGSLQCEIVEADCTIEELIRKWSLHGWVVQPFAVEDLNGNSAWNCTKGSQSVHVRATKNAMVSTLSLVMTALHNL